IKSLIRAYIECSESKKDHQTIFKLLLNDFDDAKVLREWNNIDLLVVSEQNQTLIVIENKIWSKESKHQLKKYQDKVEQFYSGYEKLFIF
ncbi:PD-(D/E)XK nuclease family protein, partial [Klebsiella pneumoniae]|nr:PD-(D/E)XK nuclease family protein [Klebsiella pneumoniae]MCP6594472.1 PD-(D/E)XK nuclease family protein [Klebsiella pneumoniae]